MGPPGSRGHTSLYCNRDDCSQKRARHAGTQLTKTFLASSTGLHNPQTQNATKRSLTSAEQGQLGMPQHKVLHRKDLMSRCFLTGVECDHNVTKYLPAIPYLVQRCCLDIFDPWSLQWAPGRRCSSVQVHSGERLIRA